MKRILVLALFLLLIPRIFAECESGQIDINSASLKELDQLYGIGPSRAQAIINARPFDSVNELIDVIGIGEITLQKIKSQGLACVGNEKDDDEKDERKEEISIKKEEKDYNLQKTEIIQKAINIEKIVLTPKSIKTEENNERLDKNNLAGYGFVIFCVLLLILFLRKKKGKNEFR